MSRLKLKMEVSADGFVGRPDGDVSWVFESGFDEGLTEHVVDLISNADAHLMGRVLYHDMAAHWPEHPDEFGVPMNAIPKIVFSSTLRDPAWGPTTVLAGDPVAEVERLKAEAGGDLLVHGGSRLAGTLSAAGLIDEYNLMLRPVALGEGLPLFTTLTPLTLQEARTFPNGVVALMYTRD